MQLPRRSSDRGQLLPGSPGLVGTGGELHVGAQMLARGRSRHRGRARAGRAPSGRARTEDPRPAPPAGPAPPRRAAARPSARSPARSARRRCVDRAAGRPPPRRRPRWSVQPTPDVARRRRAGPASRGSPRPGTPAPDLRPPASSPSRRYASTSAGYTGARARIGALRSTPVADRTAIVAGLRPHQARVVENRRGGLDSERTVERLGRAARNPSCASRRWRWPARPRSDARDHGPARTP